MKTTKQWVLTLPLIWGILSLSFAVPAFGRTTKVVYPNACSEVWSAVKDTLGNQENYKISNVDENYMTADYHPKHTVHVTVTGALVQRTNHVALVQKGMSCEMQIVSNYSGFEHNDRDDFKKRVDDSMAKLASAKPAEPAKPQDPNK